MGRGKGVSFAQIGSDLPAALGKSYNATIAQAVLELEQVGHISGQTAAAMHQMGMRGNRYKTNPITVGPGVVPTGAIPAGSAVSNIGGAIGTALGVK
jgi:hypothetical protein